MSEKLLPCPFCGSTEVMKFPPTCHEYSPYNPSDRAAPMVRCADCFAEAYGRDFDKSCKTAIAAWNRRAPSRPSQDGPTSTAYDDSGYAKEAE